MFREDSDETLTAGLAANSIAQDAVVPESAHRVAASVSTLTHIVDARTGELIEKVDWEIGDVIDGKYEVLAEVGRGGMGAVYKVRHREWDVHLAVKMPLAHLMANPDSKARFIREAQTWVDLGLHPNIVQCWYVRELGGVPRVFADYMSGGSLRDWIRNGKVKPGEWEKILDLVIQACEGLEYAHGKGVVHRDVKPSNLLMDEDGRLCVTDFGLVKVAGGAESSEAAAEDGGNSRAQPLTVTGPC